MCMARPEDVPEYVLASRRRAQELSDARSKRPVTLEQSPAHPIVCFDITPFLPQEQPPVKGRKHKGVAPTTVQLAELSQEDDVWPLMAHLGVTREQADAAVATILPGSLFGWQAKNQDPVPSTQAIPCCADPALVLGVLARTTGEFYQADRRPDYSVGHLLGNAMVFSDPRIPVQPSPAIMEVQS